MEVSPLIVVSMKSLTLRVVRANYETFGPSFVSERCYQTWKEMASVGWIDRGGYLLLRAKEVKEEIDKYCEEKGVRLSDFLRDAIEFYLKNN